MTVAKKATNAAKRRWACAHCHVKNDPTNKRCVSCGIGRATKRTSLKARADAMARELCRLLANGRCARCGKAGSDWAHRMARRHHALRWSMDNCDFLCRPCHWYLTERPFDYAHWLGDRMGAKELTDLEHRALAPWDKDYTRVLADLSAQLAEAKRRAA